MPNLNINQLFVPAPSGVNATNPQAAPSSGSWLATMLGIAGTVGLTATAWQAGGIARTMMAILATTQAQQDGLVSLMAQGGFLDWASTGTVTYVNSQGTTITAYVTPDPSIPAQNPTGAPGWLDELALSIYNVSRVFAVFASGTEYITNASGTTYGPYSPNAFHVGNPVSTATYHNTQSITIVPSPVLGTFVTSVTSGSVTTISTSTAHGLSTGAIVSIVGVAGTGTIGLANGVWIVTVTGANSFTLPISTTGSQTPGSVPAAYTPQAAQFTADIAGSSGTSIAGTITQSVTSLNGVSVYNLAQFTGTNAQSNATLASLCRAKLATISPNGPSQAYYYFALLAYALLQTRTTNPTTLIGGPVTRETTSISTSTGVVTATVANANGAVHGCAQVAITNATNVSNIVITTGTAHGLNNGDVVQITGVTGNTAANGTWTISGVTANTFTIPVAGNGAYVNGGIVEGSDLGLVDSIIQANVVPNGTVAITQSATNFNVAVVIQVWIPAALATTAAATLQSLFAIYFQNIPIGGYTDDSSQLAYTNAIVYDNVADLIGEAFPNPAGGSYVQHQTLTLNGGTANLTLTATQVAALSPTPTITVYAI